MDFHDGTGSTFRAWDCGMVSPLQAEGNKKDLDRIQRMVLGVS